MSPMDIPPIHAATTTLTATVTAIKMIDATTGLNAFEFFFIFLRYVFIFSFYLLVGLLCYCQILPFKSYVLLNTIENMFNRTTNKTEKKENY